MKNNDRANLRIVDIKENRKPEPVDCPVNDPSCTSGDDQCHDACERPTKGLGNFQKWDPDKVESPRRSAIARSCKT